MSAGSPSQARPTSEAGPSEAAQRSARPQRIAAAGRRLSSSFQSLAGALASSSLPMSSHSQASDYLDAPSLRVDGEGMTSLDDGVLARPRRRRTAQARGSAIASDSRGRSKDDANAAVGRYVDQWPSLGHLFARDDDEPIKAGRRSAHARSPTATRDDAPYSKATQRTTAPTEEGAKPGARSSVDGALPTITQEPDSFLDTDPDHIPRHEDPLMYSNNKGESLLDSDSDSDSESDSAESVETAGATERRPAKAQMSVWQKLKSRVARPELSPFTKTVTKCVIAYFIASLFTYSPALSEWMGSVLPDRDEADDVTISNMHFIATVAVYFNPGRSVGGMIEANVYAIVAFSYAITLAVVSMLLAECLHTHNAALISNIITVVFFVGGGLTLVGYAKTKVGRPTLNTACSLVGVLIFTVIVKEGSSRLGQFSTDYIWQVTLVVAAGVLTSNFVCFIVWPKSACTSLQLDIQRNLRSFSTLLKVLTKTFLLDDIKDYNIRSQRLKVAIDNHHTSFVSLKKNLEEAKLEAPFDARLRGRVSNYVYVIDSLNVLAQHLGGLRSSCSLQHELVKANREGQKQAQANGALDSAISTSTTDNLQSGATDTAFGNYLGTVGPHMRSLVFTCTRTLHSLTHAFEASLSHIDSKSHCKRDVQNTTSFSDCAKDVSSALHRFQHEQTTAIKRFYTMYSDTSLAGPSANAAKDFKADEDVFLIFYFTFLLEEFAKELERLVNSLEKIRVYEKARQGAREVAFWRRLLAFGRDHTSKGKQCSTEEPYSRTLIALFSPPSPAVVTTSLKGHKSKSNIMQDGTGRTRKQRFNYLIWRIGEMLRAQETKYAIKTGFGCAVLASPAFIPMTRAFFKRFEMQWALISFLVVLSPTVGQSNQMSVHRILGTFAGAGTALLAYFLFPDNNIALPIFGAIFSIPCFAYIIGKPQYATTGRFVLLTFNLTALYAYNLRKTGMEVESIAYHRTVSVIIGVLWATLLNHLVWPTEARRELTRGSSDLLFKLAHIYQKLVISYSSSGPQPPAPRQQRSSDETQPLLDTEHTHHLSEVQALELNAQVQLIKLEGLLVQTKHEPRLKGPFPVASYKKLLACCQHLLDLLHTMNQVVSRPDWHTRVRRDFIMPLDQTGLRRRMVGAVGLFFWLLASAFHLKTPLPPFFPPAEEARRAVVDAIRELPAVKRRAIRGSSEYLLYFAYALSMKDLIHQLEEVGVLAQDLFGVIGGSTEAWEDQFRATVEETFVQEP